MFDIYHESPGFPKKVIKWILLPLGLVIVAAITFFCIYDHPQFDYQKLLKNKDYDIVYDLDNNMIQENDKVPIINIENENISQINNDIENYYQDYLTKFTAGFRYEFSVSDYILSIVIHSKQRYVDAEYYDIHYKTYNINLKTLELMTDEDLFKEFDIEEDELRYFITYKFVNYYNDLIKEKYFTKKECDFNCFIESKNIVDFMSDNYYYVRKGQLELYKSFNIYTQYHEENYFTEKSFHFVIKK